MKPYLLLKLFRLILIDLYLFVRIGIPQIFPLKGEWGKLLLFIIIYFEVQIFLCIFYPTSHESEFKHSKGLRENLFNMSGIPI